MVDRMELGREEASWPYEAPDRTFCLRACNKTGQFLFGPEWNLADLFSDAVLLQPELPILLRDASYLDRFKARMLIRSRFPEKDFPPPVRFGFFQEPLPISEEDWELARRIEREIVADHLEGLAPVIAAHERSRKVKEFIRSACAYDKLTAFAQNSDGTFDPIKAVSWNTRRVDEWFKQGKLLAVDANGNTSYRWLFFAADELDRLLSEPVDKTPKQRRPEVRGSPISAEISNFTCNAPSSRSIGRAILRKAISVLVTYSESKGWQRPTLLEMLGLVKDDKRLGSATRKPVYETYKQFLGKKWDGTPGPRGPRNKVRQEQLTELSQHLSSAQLHK